MKGSEWAIIIVALISVLSAIFSGRSAKAAAKYNSDASVMNSRTMAETEAYERARRMDIATIERQDEEIAEIRENAEKLRDKVRTLMQHNTQLREDNQKLHQDNETLRRRIARLETQLGDHHSG